MKKTIIIFSCLLISTMSFSYNPIEKNTKNELNTAVADYPVVATTKHSVGENYSIGATVRIDDMYGTMTVYVNGSQVSYEMEGYNEYSFQYGSLGEAYYYYFKFSK